MAGHHSLEGQVSKPLKMQAVYFHHGAVILTHVLGNQLLPHSFPWSSHHIPTQVFKFLLCKLCTPHPSPIYLSACVMCE